MAWHEDDDDDADANDNADDAYDDDDDDDDHHHRDGVEPVREHSAFFLLLIVFQARPGLQSDLCCVHLNVLLVSIICFGYFNC